MTVGAICCKFWVMTSVTTCWHGIPTCRMNLRRTSGGPSRTRWPTLSCGHFVPTPTNGALPRLNWQSRRSWIQLEQNPKQSKPNRLSRHYTKLTGMWWWIEERAGALPETGWPSMWCYLIRATLASRKRTASAESGSWQFVSPLWEAACRIFNSDLGQASPSGMSDVSTFQAANGNTIWLPSPVDTSMSLARMVNRTRPLTWHQIRVQQRCKTCMFPLSHRSHLSAVTCIHCIYVNMCHWEHSLT